MDSKEYWRDKRESDRKHKRDNSHWCWQCGTRVYDSDPYCYRCQTENESYKRKGD
jgi:uncharacterized OB-fold protein